MGIEFCPDEEMNTFYPFSSLLIRNCKIFWAHLKPASTPQGVALLVKPPCFVFLVARISLLY